MAQVYVGIGSNVAPHRHVPLALAELAKRTRLLRVSPFYRSAPVGTRLGGLFWNGVAHVETPLGPTRLKHAVLRDVEARLGRRRSRDRNAPRTIDLDVLLYDDVVDPDFPLPDPAIARHPFVAVPLLDLEPDLVVPGTGERVAALPSARREGLARVEAAPDLRPLSGRGRLHPS